MPRNVEAYAELYKLLVYEKGDKFKAHKDTLRAPNHFGSLIIFLPSWYKGINTLIMHQTHSKGGDFVVRHKQRESIYNFSLDNESEQAELLR